MLTVKINGKIMHHKTFRDLPYGTVFVEFSDFDAKNPMMKIVGDRDQDAILYLRSFSSALAFDSQEMEVVVFPATLELNPPTLRK